MSPLGIGFSSAVAVLLVCWAVRSFTPPGVHHTVAVSLGVVSVYVAVGFLLFHLGRLAWLDGRLFEQVGFCAVVAVVVGWHVVSFTAAGPRRAVIEWLSASALYLALVAFFGHLSHDAWVQESTARLVAFGFLLTLFISGGIVSLANVLLSLRGPTAAQQSPTH